MCIYGCVFGIRGCVFGQEVPEVSNGKSVCHKCVNAPMLQFNAKIFTCQSAPTSSGPANAIFIGAKITATCKTQIATILGLAHLWFYLSPLFVFQIVSIWL